MINLSLKIKVKSGLHQKGVGAGGYEWSSAKSTDIWNLVSGASALITTIIYQHWGVRVCTDRAPSCGETRSWASIKASSARMLTEEATASCQTSAWTRQSRWMRINQLFLVFSISQTFPTGNHKQTKDSSKRRRRRNAHFGALISFNTKCMRRKRWGFLKPHLRTCDLEVIPVEEVDSFAK